MHFSVGMHKHHIVLNAQRCNIRTLNDVEVMQDFIHKLAYAAHTSIGHGPHALKRKGVHEGASVIALSHTAHFAMHTFPRQKEVFVEIYSFEPIEQEVLSNTFINHFRERVEYVRIQEVHESAEELECEEPSCSRPASRDWKGRKVCSDHYDVYREEEEESRRNDKTD